MRIGLVVEAIEPTLLPVIGGGQFPVRRIYCVGRNYASHIREMKEADERDSPFFFQKPRDAIVGDGAVPYPPDTTGDLIFTGTPAGVGPVVSGDRILGAIDALGTLTLTIGEKAR